MNNADLTGAARRFHQRAWRELRYAARFGIVGAMATLVHLAAVWMLIEHAELPPLAANSVAFLGAFGISFAGNYYWTFGRPGSPRAAMLRFFLVSSSAFAVNMFALAALISTDWMASSTAAVCAALLIPAATFVAGRLWVFLPA